MYPKKGFSHTIMFLRYFRFYDDSTSKPAPKIISNIYEIHEVLSVSHAKFQIICSSSTHLLSITFSLYMQYLLMNIPSCQHKLFTFLPVCSIAFTWNNWQGKFLGDFNWLESLQIKHLFKIILKNKVYLKIFFLACSLFTI